ncbi:MAG: hypothetical protein KUG68_07675 [Flavobacteriaceae bacterium]|nr:hypothetical protein [Flavobacteriaceae bacterium]
MKKLNLSKAYILSLFLLLLNYSINAQVGIGTTDPKTQLEVDGALSLREGVGLNLNDGANIDIDLGTTPYSFYRIIGPTTDFSISGITPETDADGQIVTFVNTTNNNMTIVHNSGTGSSRIYCPGENNIILSGRYSSATFQYNATLLKWNIIGVIDKSKPFDSVDLNTDQFISGSTFTAVPGMSVTFTAKKTEALVSLTVSGIAYTNSLTFASLRLYNSTTTTVIGGTNTNAQSLYSTGFSFYSITSWNASFTEEITGLTIGTSYTIILQARTNNILGTDGVAIYPLTYPDTNHATITIFQ